LGQIIVKFLAGGFKKRDTTEDYLLIGEKNGNIFQAEGRRFENMFLQQNTLFF